MPVCFLAGIPLHTKRERRKHPPEGKYGAVFLRGNYEQFSKK